MSEFYFHSLNVRVQAALRRRHDRQLRILEADGPDHGLNDTDPRPEKRIGVFDHTHRGVITLAYAMPFGKEGRWRQFPLA
jgi:hypothetical protein